MSESEPRGKRGNAYLEGWPLTRCDPYYTEDSGPYCWVHGSPSGYLRYGFPAAKNLVGWELPPLGTKCSYAEGVSRIAKQVAEEIATEVQVLLDAEKDNSNMDRDWALLQCRAIARRIGGAS